MEGQNIFAEEQSQSEIEDLSIKKNNKGESHENGGNLVANKSAQKEKIEKFKKKLFQQERDRISKISEKIRQGKDLNEFLANITREIKQELGADRVLIYRFDRESKGESGQVINESLITGWTPARDEILPCICFGRRTVNEYQSQGIIAINDINNQRLTPYQKQLLEKFQVQASLTVPIMVNAIYSSEDSSYALNQVWGLLVVQQCDGEKHWKEEEINLVDSLSREITLALHQDRPRINLAQQKDIFTTINQEMQQLMQEMSEKLGELIKADRVLVYGFNPDWSGEVLAESIKGNWERAGSAFARDFFLRGEQYKQYYVANDIYAKDLARCSIEALEKIQAKAYIVVPIEQNNQLQGLLGAYQNSGPRNWQTSEINAAIQFASQLSFPLQQTEFLRKTRFQTKQMETAFKREKELNKIFDRIRLAKEEKTVYQVATQEGRKLLGVDRLAVYRFNPDWSGEFIAESVAAGWTSLIEKFPIVKDTYLQENKGGRYQFGECFAVDDIYLVGHQACHIELLEQFEARSYAIAPIILEDKKLWGMLAAYQNSGVRKWLEEEVEVLRQMGIQIGVALQRIDYVGQLEVRAEQEQTVAKIVDRIRQSLKLNEIFKTATQEVRQILKADRVIVYRFNPDWSGEAIVESMGQGWVSVMEIQQVDKTLYNSEMSADDRCTIRNLAAGSVLDRDTYFLENKGGDYNRGKKFRVINNVYDAGFTACYLESLEKYQAKAYIIAPIVQGGQLWGLFAAYQNSAPRDWKDSEIRLLTTIGTQLGVAIQQAEYTEKIQIQSQQDRAVSRMVERIRSSSDLNSIFSNATQEMRRLLKTDRAVVYRFNPDWSGQVVAEACGAEWISVIEIQQVDKSLYTCEMSADNRCTIKDLKAGFAFDTDTYFKETRGGEYAKGQTIKIIDDVYSAGFSPCYLNSLEKYQAKAYIIAPIFKDNQIWGLFGVYQNSEARKWKESDANLILQITGPLGLAIKQAEYLEQVKSQSENLAQALQREKSAKEEIEKQALQMLSAVRPAFKGDLTVRAKVTDNQIGTIAAAYNTTLDSLQDIVIQVKAAVEKVAGTATESNTCITGLSTKAQLQFKELNLALTRIEETIETLELTTQKAREVEGAIERANQTVKTGDLAMNKTVESISEIRSFVTEAGKRVKRLSESSQKISKVVSLISTFATQTNLLALNAALEATRAGEYGKGFAVVADEVRNLSLQSAEATTEIEKLVQKIQEETNEVAGAMEKGVEQVAEGTSMVNETRQSLNDIVDSTGEISQLVAVITNATDVQMEKAESVMNMMGQVAGIANDTSSDSLKISASFQELLAMAQDLQDNVAKFKVD